MCMEDLHISRRTITRSTVATIGADGLARIAPAGDRITLLLMASDANAGVVQVRPTADIQPAITVVAVLPVTQSEPFVLDYTNRPGMPQLGYVLAGAAADVVYVTEVLTDKEVANEYNTAYGQRSRGDG